MRMTFNNPTHEADERARPEKPATTISVVIPDYGYSPYLVENVAALLSGTRSPDELIVSHSGPHDPTERLQSRFPSLRVIHTAERLLAGAARNRGALEASGNWIAFMDSDVRPTERWLESLWAAVESGVGRLVVGSVGYEVSGGYWGLCLWICEFSGQFPHLPSEHRWAGASCNMLVERQALLNAGGFPSEFQPGEDTTLFARLREQGERQWFASDAEVRHINPSGFNRFVHHQLKLGKWSAVCRRLFPLDGAIAAKIWPLALVLWFVRLALISGRVIRGGPPFVWRHLWLFPGVCLGTILWNVGFFEGLAAPLPKIPSGPAGSSGVSRVSQR